MLCAVRVRLLDELGHGTPAMVGHGYWPDLRLRVIAMSSGIRQHEP